MPIRVDGITLTLTGSEKSLARRAAARLGVSLGSVREVEILRRSLDARDKKKIRWVYTLLVTAADEAEILRRMRADRAVRPALAAHTPLPAPRSKPPRAVIVGSGPAGLFAADLLAGAGAPPVILERGRPVETRQADIAALLEGGVVDGESNLCFGEGGAGTYSDGKLYTRGTDPFLRHVYRTFVELGAPADILYDAAPHLGSDRLPDYVRAFRERLTERGVEFRFGARVEDVRWTDGRVRGVTLADGEEIDAAAVVLAIGHSAADFARRLHAKGLPVAAKGFAVGARIEHPQAAIDRLQYGHAAGHPNLPPAAYRITHQTPERRGVYSFCMCPGGMVLPSATDAAHLVVNGGSDQARSGSFANAAIVVAVGPEDFGDAPLAGLEFRESIERGAAAAGAAIAPAQRAIDFLAGRASREVPPTSYRPRVEPADLAAFLPPFVVAAMRDGLAAWHRRMNGFAGPEAVLIGVETRTSSPWRLLRDERYRAGGIEGLIVAGEGAGYAGGIASSAVDGLRAALALCE